MQSLRELLSWCFSFRGRVAPQPYIIGSVIVLGVYGALFFFAPLIGTALVFVLFSGGFEDTPAALLLFYLPYILYLLPMAAQFSIAARRLRDAGRSQAYLALPPVSFVGLCILDMLFMLETLEYLTTAEPLTEHEGPALFAGTAMLAGFGILLAAALSAMSFLLFGLFRRKESAQADETA